jgi:diguanylate cyclase (GGDEF)-like protein
VTDPAAERQLKRVNGTRARLLTIVCALAGLTLAVGMIGIFQIREVDAGYDALVRGEARVVEDVLEMRNALNEQAAAVGGYVAGRGRGWLSPAFTAPSAPFHRALTDAQAKVAHPRDVSLLAGLARDYPRLMARYRRQVALVRSGHHAEAAIVAAAAATLERLEEVQGRQRERLSAKTAEARRTSDLAVAELTALALLALALSGLLAFVVWRRASALTATLAEQRELASVDPLTGLANRRTFDRSLSEEFARARRHGRRLSLVLFDLDHFKRVNDVHGHPVGDLVLRETGARLLGGARETDLIARVGGEEFAWLMPETAAGDALLVAERARSLVSGSPFPVAGRLTASAGICNVSWAESAEDLYRRADEALYTAKRLGRDAAVVYGEGCAENLDALELIGQPPRTVAGQPIKTGQVTGVS